MYFSNRKKKVILKKKLKSCFEDRKENRQQQEAKKEKKRKNYQRTYLSTLEIVSEDWLEHIFANLKPVKRKGKKKWSTTIKVF